MRLETPRLIVRSPVEEDINTSLLIWSDPQVRKFSGGPSTEAQIRQGFLEELKISDTHFGFRTVVEKETGNHVGDCGLIEKTIEEVDVVELVYFFLPEAWGKGYATEAGTALRDYGFSQADLKRLVALIHPENLASKKVAQKLRFQFEKTITTPTGNLREMFSLSA